jgi:hypothetical protein
MNVGASHRPAPLSIPRHARNLDSIAERAGMRVSTCAEPSSADNPQLRLWSRWEGSKQQLRSLGLLTPGQEALLARKRSALTVPGTAGQWLAALIYGHLETTGDQASLAIDHGPAEYRAEQRGDLEIISYRHLNHDIVSYHGSIEDLVAAGIDRKRLPTGKQSGKCGWFAGSSAWMSRMQPDGTCVYRVETGESWRRNHPTYERNNALCWAAQGFETSTQKPRPAYLRLVVDNTVARSGVASPT